MNSSIWSAIKQGAASGAYFGGYPFARNAWFVGDNAPQGVRRVGSVEELFAIATAGDVAYLGPGGYEEGNLVIPETLSNFTLIGTGGRGACFIEAPDAGDEGIQVLADDVTFINVGVASDDTGSYSLKIGSQTVSPARFRAFGCKIEGNEAVNPGGQVVLHGCGDIIFDDCEFCWGVNGIIGQGNDDGWPTQILVQNSLFHDLTTVHFGIAAASHFVELWAFNNRCMGDESGVAPTDFILLSDNANIGNFTGNYFANATNATGVLTIGTGILWGPNGTEAGWSTARPA